MRSTAEREWLEAAGGSAAIEMENRILSAGREFLPPCAVAVLDGGVPSDEYWKFLTSQLA